MVDDSLVTPLNDVQVDDHLNYIERLVAILKQKTKPLCNKVVSLVMVQWNHWKGSEWM